MNFNNELLNVVNFNFVNSLIDKERSVSKALDKLDTMELAYLFKEEVEDNLDFSELRDNILDIILERTRDEMVDLVLEKIFKKYVSNIALKILKDLKVTEDKNKTIYQVFDDTYDLVEDKIFDKVFDEVVKKVDEKIYTSSDIVHKKVDEVFEIVKTF